MNLIYLFCLFVFFPFTSFAEEELSQFKVVRNNNIETSKVFETKDFYFSQVSYDWTKKSNRKKLSRKGSLKSISMFKDFIFNSKVSLNLDKFKTWGTSNFLKNQLNITQSRKIEDRRFKAKYLVVYSFPKNSVSFKSTKINLNDLVLFNTQNHTNFNKVERNKFLKKLGFKDIILLWKINELAKNNNLNNVLSVVDPIEYQKRIMTVIKVDKPNLSLLNITPAFDYVIDKYLKTNKPDNYYEYLAILSAKCSSDDEFTDNLIKNNIEILNKNTFSFDKSNILKALLKCKGFLRFQKNINKPAPSEILNIEKKFSQGKNLDNLILLIEKTLSNTPLSFKLWNYYSACLRAKNKFQEALLVSRVELSIALQLSNMNMYFEALKSYSKSRIKLKKEYNEQQKQFLKTNI